MFVRLFFLSLLLFSALSSGLVADVWQKEGLQIDRRVLVQPMPGKKMTAAYLRIVNAGKTDRQLVSIGADFAKKIEIHTVAMQDGVMKMRPLPAGLVVPAGEQVELAPGGLHIMLMGLNQPLEPGSEVRIRLRFADSSEAILPFRIVSRAELMKDLSK